MNKQVAKFLTLVFVVTSLVVWAPAPLHVDVVSAATGEPTTTTPTTTTAPPKTTTSTTAQAVNGVYTVVKGDCFWTIAKKLGVTMEELARLNPQVTNIRLIHAGEKLTVKTAAPATTVAEKKYYHGFGEVSNYRLGHTSLNLTTASVIFDQDGKIVDLKWDVQEMSPELFTGWVDEKTVSAADQAAFKAKIDDQWKTKWEEKDEYGMKASAISGKEWFEQMGFYETFFKGMTVQQVKDWAAKYTDPKTMRPWKLAYLNNPKLKDADKAAATAATANFTAQEKQMLVDVTTSATMSLQDDHSHFLTALQEAYNARTEIK